MAPKGSATFSFGDKLRILELLNSNRISCELWSSDGPPEQHGYCVPKCVEFINTCIKEGTFSPKSKARSIADGALRNMLKGANIPVARTTKSKTKPGVAQGLALVLYTFLRDLESTNQVLVETELWGILNGMMSRSGEWTTSQLEELCKDRVFHFESPEPSKSTTN